MDPERFTGLLFAPVERREELFVLHAFAAEIGRAVRVASDPTLALIRLQWWREVVDGVERRHEVATPLRAALEAGVFERAALLAMIEAREMEVEGEPDEAAWRAWLGATGGVLAVQAARALGGGEVPGLADLGAGIAAVQVLRASTGAGWRRPEAMDEAAHRQVAAGLLGRARGWPEAAMPAVLPALAARAWLDRGHATPTRTRLAMLWGAAVRRA